MAERNPLTVLLTNFELDVPAGSQLYVRDVALGLLKRGHRPIVYSPRLGRVASELTAATVAVVDDLTRVSVRPDVLHGQQNHELFAALLRFPGVPAVRFCHGWGDDPPHQFPRILRYVAVDETTRDRCVAGWGIPEDRIELLFNFVDLRKFAVLRTALPDTPKRALVFSNYARRHLWAVAAACSARGLPLDAVGETLGNAVSAPQHLLGEYDIVFAKARAAIEAMASGAAVILCDAVGVGPMVTSADLMTLRRQNFGVRALRDPLSPEAIERQIVRYDARDAREVTRQVRAMADADLVIDALIDLYDDVIDSHRRRGADDPVEEMRAASAYLETIGRRIQWLRSPRSSVFVMLSALSDKVDTVPGLRQLNRSRLAYRLTQPARRLFRSLRRGRS